jgi:hypothetical protein
VAIYSLSVMMVALWAGSFSHFLSRWRRCVAVDGRRIECLGFVDRPEQREVRKREQAARPSGRTMSRCFLNPITTVPERSRLRWR